MRVFLHEYVTVELAGQADVPASLRAEGWAMFSAVREDFARIPGVEVTTLSPQDCRSSVGLAERFRQLAADVDWSLVIAPEFDDILFTRCRWVEEAGGPLLGPSSAAVRLTGDKLALSAHLRERGVPTPPCRSSPPAGTVPPKEFPLVLKPRCGAGSLDTFLLRGPADLAARAAAADMILQPFVPGQPASVMFFLGPSVCLACPPATQELADFHYTGGVVPGLAGAAAATVTRLARQAVEAVPGLRGFVGVDVILGEEPGSSAVIEINPRLTTSYVGLRALAETNLAEVMLRVVAGESDVEVRWRPASVRFRPDGTVADVMPG